MASVTIEDQNRNEYTLAIADAQVTTGNVQAGDLLFKVDSGNPAWVQANASEVGQPVVNSPSWYATIRETPA